MIKTFTSLPKVVARRLKRLGRGYGSGKGGHTTGRGQKGQKARGKIGILFEGVKVKQSLIKKIPFLRGKGKFKPGMSPLEVDLNKLNLFKEGSKVDLSSLISLGIVEKSALKSGVKILGNGDIKKKISISSRRKLRLTAKAIEKIKKAKGEVLYPKYSSLHIK